jgi:glycosyltransferase involved in cell wall biosynthesis
VMAAGKPVIASPVGANAQVVQHGVNGFLADTPTEWADALRRLEDPDLRRRMGEEARKTVEEQYSTAVVRPRLAAILAAAAGR